MDMPRNPQKLTNEKYQAQFVFNNLFCSVSGFEFGFIGIHVKPEKSNDQSSNTWSEINSLADVYDYMKTKWNLEVINSYI